MLNPREMTVTQGADQFYPTPPALAEKMLEGIDFNLCPNVLEPSGGKGDLIEAFLRKRNAHRYNYNYTRYYSIDVCEIDPYLRSIIKYNLGPERKEKAYQESEAARDAYNRARRADSDPEEVQHLEDEWMRLQDAYNSLPDPENVRIVHDDFLTYRTAKNYQLILMNPPFATGAAHLLKAISMQEVSGGDVICLLNAETLRNPCAPERVALAKKLQKYEAQVEYVEDAMADAERPARVDVAIVRVHVPAPEAGESDIWERMKKAVDAEEMPDPELEALVSGDYIEQAIRLYQTEVAATLELVKHYRQLCPYMSRKLNADDSFDKAPILTLTVGDDNYIHGFDLNKYLRTVRLKYWNALFDNKKFIGRLTSTLAKRFHETVDKMAEYEFSAFNIKQVAFEMNQAMREGVEQEILHLFDELSAQHSWYPECTQNRHYYNGWATNKAHKIGKKCIIPVNGMFSSYSWARETFDVHHAYGVISNLEKALDYLSAQPEDNGYSLEGRLAWANSGGKTRNIECKYFKIDLYKKGTMHIKFLDDAMPIVDRLNIYASRKKNWLPPNYGKASYSNMDADARAVVDSFHGDGTGGSGVKEYEKVLSQSAYYLADPAQRPLALTE